MGRTEMEWRLNDLESAMNSLDDAVGAMRTLGESANSPVIEYLKSVHAELAEEAKEIEGWLAEDDAKEDAALEAEYWRSVI